MGEGQGRGSDLYLCKTRCQREIEAADRPIDQLVYELYGLTEEEIKIGGGRQRIEVETILFTEVLTSF